MQLIWTYPGSVNSEEEEVGDGGQTEDCKKRQIRQVSHMSKVTEDINWEVFKNILLVSGIRSFSVVTSDQIQTVRHTKNRHSFEGLPQSTPENPLFLMIGRINSFFVKYLYASFPLSKHRQTFCTILVICRVA